MSYKAASGVKTRERKAISRNFTTIFIGVFLAGNGNKRIGEKKRKNKQVTTGAQLRPPSALKLKIERMVWCSMVLYGIVLNGLMHYGIVWYCMVGNNEYVIIS